MFFKNIDTWSQSKLRIYSIIFNILYLISTLIVPIIIVGCRYQIFSSDRVRLTGWGWILAIFVAVVGFKTVNKLINKLPETTHKEQCFKYTILGVKSLVLPVLVLVAMRLLKNDFELAYNTLWWILFSCIAGIVIEYTVLKYFDKEIEFRRKAKEKIEVDKRVELLKK